MFNVGCGSVGSNRQNPLFAFTVCTYARVSTLATVSSLQYMYILLYFSFIFLTVVDFIKFHNGFRAFDQNTHQNAHIAVAKSPLPRARCVQ